MTRDPHRARPPMSPADFDLWERVTHGVRPLREPARRPSVPRPAREATHLAQPPQPTAHRPLPPAKPAPPPLAAFDRRTRQKIGRGAIEIDGRIDLHGCTQNVAHERLIRFLAAAQAKGHRLVLVITGKGAPAGARHDAEARGILRRMVPLWLRLPELRRMVVGFEAAGPGHGGEGALYVRIRRRDRGDRP